MNQQVVNTPLLNSKCCGNLNYDGRLTDIPNQSQMRTQKVSVTFDSLVTIKEIVLNNSMGTDKPFVRISLGSSAIDSFNCTTEGAGYEKNIRIVFKNPLQIGPCGLLAEVYADRVGFHNDRFRNYCFLSPELIIRSACFSSSGNSVQGTSRL